MWRMCIRWRPFLRRSASNVVVHTAEMPSELTACEVIRAVADGTLTAEAMVRSCLERIEELEPLLKVWAFVDAVGALSRARRCDREPRRGPLHGVPIGVKDVIETVDMPTEYGAPYYRGWQPNADAACVALLKRAGAIVLGKTVTTELACGAAAANANPWNPRHTAGGSSGGSTAAVAARMVPVALGTQTAGSLIRPASYNGVVTIKPTFGALSVAGCKYFNGSLDTLGLIARTVDDVFLLWRILLGLEPGPAGPFPSPPRLGLCRTPWWTRADDATRRTLEAAAERLAAYGARIVDITLPAPFESLVEVHQRIQAFEAARSYAFEYDAFRDQLHPNVCNLIEQGLGISYADYRGLLATADDCRRRVWGVFDGVDALIAPSAPGEAPEGHHDLGNSFLNRPWTLLHVPCINIPGLSGPRGLPVGVQLIAPPAADERLMAVAGWVERRIERA